MSKSISYSCDLCGFTSTDKKYFIGISMPNNERQIEPNQEWTDSHICKKCVTFVQCGIPQICIGGYECQGGLRCTSDHK